MEVLDGTAFSVYGPNVGGFSWGTVVILARENKAAWMMSRFERERKDEAR